MKHLFTIVGFSLLLAATACGGGNRDKKTAEAEEEDIMTEAQTFGWDNLPDEPIFDIVTNMGLIKVKLYSGTPKHRENFIKHVKEGYYDGVLFHRVIKDFMIQTGDPLSRDHSIADKWGTGGPDYTVPAEFVPEYCHKKGALAAARRGDAANPTKASSGSQFYIVQNEFNCTHLDGEYTVFGETIEGLDIIDQIAEVATDTRDRPQKDVVILKIELSAEQETGAENADTAPEVAEEPNAGSEQTDSTAEYEPFENNLNESSNKNANGTDIAVGEDE